MKTQTQIIQAIDIQEDKDRSIATNFINKVFTYSIIEYTPTSARSDMFVSGYTTYSSAPYNIEVKERYIYANKYKEAYLEADKYEALQMYKNTHYSVYLCIYKDKILVWNLSKIDMNKVKKDWRLMNKKTFEGEKKVNKLVYLLPINLAKKFDRYDFY